MCAWLHRPVMITKRYPRTTQLAVSGVRVETKPGPSTVGANDLRVENRRRTLEWPLKHLVRHS